MSLRSILVIDGYGGLIGLRKGELLQCRTVAVDAENSKVLAA
jgi:hypothetical protein